MFLEMHEYLIYYSLKHSANGTSMPGAAAPGKYPVNKWCLNETAVVT